tara:strand:- start:200 stop:487 length:288 start_codon:yes stop_codon:yes gene_type:complete
MKFNCPKVNFNSIANAISVASGVTLAGIIGFGSYVYVNKDAIIDDIKQDAIESITGGGIGGLAGGALTGDTNPFAGENAAVGGTSMGLPVPGSPF